MCGLTALISKTLTGFSTKDISLFKQAVYTTSLRGEDSTGVFSVKDSGNVDMLKSAVFAPNFVKSTEFTNFLAEAYTSSRIMVGHCRAATKGEKTDKNAHPFISDNTILVHNGTLYEHKSLADTETDSEAVTIAFSKKDPLEVLPEIYGAYAFIWYNAETKKLCITRNKERPLFIIQTDEFDLIGSESGQIEWLYERIFNKTKEAQYFEVEKIYTWDLTNLKEGFDLTDVPKKIHQASPTYQTNWHTGQNTTGVNKTNLDPYNNSNTDKGTIHLDEKVFGDLCYSDVIVVDVTAVEIFNSGAVIEGKNEKYPNIIFRAHKSVYTSEAREQHQNATRIRGRVTGRNTNQTEHVVYLADAVPLITMTTLIRNDNTAVTIVKSACMCHRCHAQITPADNHKLWFRIKNGNVKTLYCPVCVTQHHPQAIKALT